MLPMPWTSIIARRPVAAGGLVAIVVSALLPLACERPKPLVPPTTAHAAAPQADGSALAEPADADAPALSQIDAAEEMDATADTMVVNRTQFVFVEDPPHAKVTTKCQAGGKPYRMESLCVRGRQTYSGEILDSDTVRFEVRAEGCLTYGSVYRRDASCKVRPGGPRELLVETRFCAWAKMVTGMVPSSCGTSGIADCTTAGLVPGEYVVKSEKLKLTFSLPSSVPHGGVCAVWDRRQPPVSEYDWLLHPRK
jgi:hypothetical protein